MQVNCNGEAVELNCASPVSLTDMALANQQLSTVLDENLATAFTSVREASTGLCAHLARKTAICRQCRTRVRSNGISPTPPGFLKLRAGEFNPGYQPVNPLYSVLFNSYYNGVGEQFPRPQRSVLSRPTLDDVFAYRVSVDAAVAELLNEQPDNTALATRVELGLHHEAQHQELMLTDIKYCLFQNPLLPAYREHDEPHAVDASALHFIECAGGQLETGFGGDSFCFDNELPRHTDYVAPFKLANRLVTNGEFLAFVEDGGYQNPEHWLADGWNEVQEHHWQQPLYWGNVDGQWLEYTLNGLQSLDEAAPVSHVSYFEAQAYASWAGKRLPTEAEWESVASHSSAAHANFVAAGHLHPTATSSEVFAQLFGDCWEWTQSAYLPYPGYQPLAGAVGEYNGKFMSGQMVLRGGSCLSQAFHIRSSYRNFFYPRDRWQCSGIRLAADT